MRCDYIRATFRGDQIFRDGRPQDLFGVRLLDLQSVLGGEWQHQKKSANGYAIRFALVRDEDVICYAMTQGAGDAEGTHQIEASGHHSPEVREALNQTIGPMHYATARRDTCFDLIDDDNFTLFHQLAALGRDMSKAGRMKYDQIGQGWITPGQTMTIYLGSRNSPVMIRIYTRGLKTLAEGGMDDPRRIRVEVEVKPGKRQGKDSLSLLDDHTLFGCSGWSKEFIERAGVSGIERHKVGTVWKPSDKQRVFAHMIKQYGGLLEELLDQKGPEGLAKMIRDQRRVDYQIREKLRSLEIAEEVEQW